MILPKHLDEDEESFARDMHGLHSLVVQDLFLKITFLTLALRGTQTCEWRRGRKIIV
jgi:hypothetical protein